MDSGGECLPRGEERFFPLGEEKDAASLPFPMNEPVAGIEVGAGDGPKKVVAQGFGKKFKIKKNREIRALLDRGRRYGSPLFKICCMSNGLNWSRFALVTPRAVGNAVARNRTRRVMREILRKEPAAAMGLDILFRLNDRTGSAGADALREALAGWYDSLKK
jgi:ribonuclease P protein component